MMPNELRVTLASPARRPCALTALDPPQAAKR
jgi:hypothetical protein